MIRKYLKGDVLRVLVQQEQALETLEAYTGFEKITAFTILDDNNEVLGVFGFDLYQKYEARCYAFIGKNIGFRLKELICFLRKYIPYKMKKNKILRAELTVKSGFRAGDKMARMLGFRAVENLPSFFNLFDYVRYERINK